jgi:hypothetical protein
VRRQSRGRGDFGWRNVGPSQLAGPTDESKEGMLSTKRLFILLIRLDATFRIYERDLEKIDDWEVPEFEMPQP